MRLCSCGQAWFIEAGSFRRTMPPNCLTAPVCEEMRRFFTGVTPVSTRPSYAWVNRWQYIFGCPGEYHMPHLKLRGKPSTNLPYLDWHSTWYTSIIHLYHGIEEECCTSSVHSSFMLRLWFPPTVIWMFHNLWCRKYRQQSTGQFLTGWMIDEHWRGAGSDQTWSFW